ncbi:MAG: acetyl-CoA carboxylase biotin carboxyl carrier protein subunit [Rikenellaceae bacterium]
MEDKTIKIYTENGGFETLAVTPTHLRRKKWQPKNPKLVLSIIPGTIVEISVKVGDEVAVGDQLMIFKAMKMDSVVCSEIDGKVKALHCSEGDIVSKGTTIIEFE